MNDEDQLNEYVLNDNGKVWQGTYKEPKGYQWFFGQFEAVVLPSVMMLLDRASIPHQDRADPVKVARTISAIVSATLIICLITKIVQFSRMSSIVFAVTSALFQILTQNWVSVGQTYFECKKNYSILISQINTLRLCIFDLTLTP